METLGEIMGLDNGTKDKSSWLGERVQFLNIKAKTYTVDKIRGIVKREDRDDHTKVFVEFDDGYKGWIRKNQLKRIQSWL